MAKKQSRGPGAELAEVRRRLEEAEDSLNAIRTGAIDALVIKGPGGDQIYTLRDADKPYRAVIENMRDGVVTVREDGLILYANKQLAAMFRQPLETLIGSSLFDQAGEAGGAALRTLVDEAREAGAHADVEMRTASGRAVLLHLSLAPMRIEGIRVLAGVAADITEERETQGKIRQMERTEALGRLAGGIAHDLNNILQPILVNAELLLSETEPGTRPSELLKNLIKAANRQKELVTKILAFTRKARQVLRPVSVTPIVADALNMLKPSLPATVEVRLIAESRGDTILGDPAEIHEIITNLFSNAADAVEDAGGVIEVSLRDERLAEEAAALGLKPGPYMKLSVKDTGVGIPPTDLERIFDPFFTTKETGRGTGIGLSVVRGIVKGHGGSIRVDSQVGRGTEAVVFLPVADASQVQAAGVVRDLPRALPGPGRRVLLVDDEELVLEAMRGALTSFGHTLTAVNNAEAALALVHSLPTQFDLAVVDQNMPRMSGLELAAEIRKLNPDMPILLATGYSRAADDASLREAGVTAVVMKPLSLKDLSTAVNRALATGPDKI